MPNQLQTTYYAMQLPLVLRTRVGEHQSGVNATETGSLLVEFLLQPNKEQECLQVPTTPKGTSFIPQTRIML